MSLTFQIATSDDFHWLGSLDEELNKNTLRKKIAMGEIALALVDGQRIGFLRWGYFWDSIPFMNMLIFDEPFRRSGYGTRLVAYWEDLMRKTGAKLVLTSSLSDEYGQHFYRKNGYRDMGSLLFPDQALEIIFVKKL